MKHQRTIMKNHEIIKSKNKIETKDVNGNSQAAPRQPLQRRKFYFKTSSSNAIACRAFLSIIRRRRGARTITHFVKRKMGVQGQNRKDREVIATCSLPLQQFLACATMFGCKPQLESYRSAADASSQPAARRRLLAENSSLS